jgi:hypothetical protein
MIFNECIVYKDMSSAELDIIELKPTKSEFVNLDEPFKGIVHNRDHEDETLTDSSNEKQFLEVELDE